MRTYAIGDIHGCRGLLAGLLGQVDRDAGGRLCRIVCLGDYIDRGPDSAGVVALLRARQAAEPPGGFVCLKGNHEAMLLDALDGPPGAARHWRLMGGDETLDSFGVARPAEMPADVFAWLRACPTFFEDEWRHYVHAGLNPAFGREAQRDEDRLWIREPFLESKHDFGRYVVHGHTPLRGGRADVRARRVNLDTAAVYGGRLTAAIFTDGPGPPVGFLQEG